MLFVPHNHGIGQLSSVWKEVIVSVTPGVAAIGCLFAGPLSNYIGRRKIILVASLVFVIGALVCAGAVERYMLLFGRVLLGIAIGIRQSNLNKFNSLFQVLPP
jgi:SP family myo-inositol transporter-like MFS transporter 13